MSPGETRDLTVELGNHGARSVRVRTYAADAYTIVNGGFGAKLDGEPTSGATRWLDYLADTLEFESLADRKALAQVVTQPLSLRVLDPEAGGPPQPIGVAPQPAAISQSPNAPADPGQLSRVLAGGCLVIAVALLGVYSYQRKRRKPAQTPG